MDLRNLKGAEVLEKTTEALARQRRKHSERNARYQFHRDLFDNKYSAWWSGKNGMPAPPIRNRYSLTFNFVAPLVEKWASFIMADELNWAVIPKRPDVQGHQQAQNAENILYAIHERSLSHRTLNEIALDAALLGTGWAKTLYDTLDKKTKFVYCRPEFVYPEPYVSVFSGDFRYVLYAYEVEVDVAREEYNDSSIAPAALLEGERDADKEKAEDVCAVIEFWSKDNWALIVGNKVVEVGGGYGFIPYINFPLLCHPGKIFGTTFVDWILEANAYYNQLSSQIADATRLNCNPPLLYKNAPPDYRDQMAKAASGGGGVIPLGRDSDVEPMVWPGEPASVELLLNRVQNFIHDVSHMPKIAFGDMSQAINSSRVLSIQYDPVIKVIRQARDNFTIALKRLNENLLRLAEKWEKKAEIVVVPADNTRKFPIEPVAPGSQEIRSLKGADISGQYETKVIWPGVLPKDDAGAARLEIEKKGANLQSTRTTMENLGVVDPEAELTLMLSELSDERLHPKEQATTLTAMSKALGAINAAAPPQEQPPALPPEQAAPPVPPTGGVPERGVVPGVPGPETAPLSPEEQANMEAQKYQGG